MTDQRNVVLVTVDSLRADHCGFMGYDGGTTPTMDRMAEDGLTFTNAVAPGPATLDSMPVVFTGEDVHARDTDAAVKSVHERFEHHMRARDTLPERLSRRGYETAAFTANPWTSRYFGFDEGFDHFEDFMDVDRSTGLIERSLEETGDLNTDSRALYALQLLLNWTQEMNMFQSWGSFYDDIVAWTEQTSEPYFLWVFLVDVHMPYLPQAGFRTGSRLGTYASNLWLYLGNDGMESTFREPLIRSYDDTIRYVDAHLDQLTRDLSDDDPLYVVHADHGEEFGEHGVYGHGPDIYEEQIHSPLLVGNGPTGTVEEPFSLTNLSDLVTGLADGDDVTTLGEPVVKAQNRDPKIAARGETWKYIRTESGEELYDLRDGEHREVDDEGLRALGRDLVDGWEEADSECQRVGEAARVVAGDHEL